MRQARIEDEQARYRAELRRNGALRRALLRNMLADVGAVWSGWFAGWFRRA